jgi:hypothetical protein
MKLLQLAGTSGLVYMIGAQTAFAIEWRYCIAPSSQEQRIYMTPPFLATTSLEVMENGFHQALIRSGHRHDSVQCAAAANEQAAYAMRRHADEFNRQMGNEVIQIDWKPGATR